MNKLVSLAVLSMFSLALAGGGGTPTSPSPAPVVRPASTDPDFPGATLVTFRAADGLPVSAFYTPGPASAPILLLFHQAGSNKYEYREIAPRLRQLGYGSLAVDARSGEATHAGEHRNLTNEAYRKKTGNTDAGYDEAYQDLVAALKWIRIREPGRPVYLLGSSYSAELVFQLAAEYPDDVQAVLSFSPMGRDAALVNAAKVRVPVFLTSASDEGEIERARNMLDAVGSQQKTQFKPEVGPHGASALTRTFNLRGFEAYWQAMTAFLNTLRSAR